MRVGRVAATVTGALLACAVAATCGGGASQPPVQRLVGIHKIQHVVVIMQENRSFDSYFGTFAGSDGFPTTRGVITVCVPDPRTRRCVAPFPDHRDANFGGPHGQGAARVDRPAAR